MKSVFDKLEAELRKRLNAHYAALTEHVKLDTGDPPVLARPAYLPLEAEVAHGVWLDQVARRTTRDSVQRKPYETDVELRERLRAAFNKPRTDDQVEALRYAYSAHTHGVPVAQVHPEILASINCAAVSCGTCPRCRKYKGEL